MKQYKNKIEFKYKKKILEIKKKFETKDGKNYKDIKDSSKQKEVEIIEKAKDKIEDLKKKYPGVEMDKNFKEKIDSMFVYAVNVKDYVKSMFFFEKKKKKNSEIHLEIIKNDKTEKYSEELDKIKNDKDYDLYQNLLNEVKSMCQITEKDNEIFIYLENLKNNKIKETEDYFNLNDEKKIINNIENIKNMETNNINIIKNEEDEKDEKDENDEDDTLLSPILNCE